MTLYRQLAKQPISLLPNRVWRTYSGGKLLDRFHNAANPQDRNFPEEWIASVIRASNIGRAEVVDEGLSLVRLENGATVTLESVIASSPEAFLGPQHVEIYGAHTAVLVKLLDAAERLTIQVHPDNEFARTRFHSRFGKTEAWYVIGTRDMNGELPSVWLGFKPGMTREYWKTLFDAQNIQGMLDGLHRIPVEEGQVILIKGGVPHAIGAGCLLVEIQEPTDFTLRTERVTPGGLPVPDQACHQGLGFDVMLDCFHYDTYTEDEIRKNWFLAPKTIISRSGGTLRSLVSENDTERFKMNLLTVLTQYEDKGENGFRIAIVLDGEGELEWPGGRMTVSRGRLLFFPAELHSVKWNNFLDSAMKVVLCGPPRT